MYMHVLFAKQTDAVCTLCSLGTAGTGVAAAVHNVRQPPSQQPRCCAWDRQAWVRAGWLRGGGHRLRPCACAVQCRWLRRSRDTRPSLQPPPPPPDDSRPAALLARPGSRDGGTGAGGTACASWELPALQPPSRPSSWLSWRPAAPGGGGGGRAEVRLMSVVPSRSWPPSAAPPCPGLSRPRRSPAGDDVITPPACGYVRSSGCHHPPQRQSRCVWVSRSRAGVRACLHAWGRCGGRPCRRCQRGVLHAPALQLLHARAAGGSG